MAAGKGGRFRRESVAVLEQETFLDLEKAIQRRFTNTTQAGIRMILPLQPRCRLKNMMEQNLHHFRAKTPGSEPQSPSVSALRRPVWLFFLAAVRNCSHRHGQADVTPHYRHNNV